jgi:branched-chain amino acid transport system substrate-binding protein
VLAGCAAAGTSTLTVSGRILTIYASAPASGIPQLSQDMIDAEQLALQRDGNQVGKYTIRFKKLDGRVSDNARTAIQDTHAIAYLGELAPGASADSMGITNAQDLLEVSPSDTALELTQTSAAVPGAPDSYYESLGTYGRTFARVVPSSAHEAKAQVLEMQALGVKTLYVADDGSNYGKAIALAVRDAAAPALMIVSDAASADAMFYGAASPSTATRAFQSASQAAPRVKLFGPSALDDPSLAAGMAPVPRQLYISSPGFLRRNLTPEAQAFAQQFQSAYGRAPGLQAIFGYEAMNAVLAVLRQAGAGANDRTKVVHDFFAIRNRESVLGTYSINSDGDTSVAPFVFSRLQHGRLVPFAQVEG